MKTSPPYLRPNTGFSLIELLVVIAIIVLVAGFAVTGISSMSQARGATEAGYQVAAAVELARAEAIARNTFVWLGLQKTTTSGNADLLIGLVYSKDGTLNTAATNLQPIGRALTIKQVALAAPANAPSGATTLDSGTPAATFKIGQANFTDLTLLFAPTGEIARTAPATPADFRFDNLLALGLQPARGTDFTDTNNTVDILIDGSVGIARVQRAGETVTP